MLVRRLQECFLTNTSQDGVRPVLVLDEAHDLRPDVLDMLRILTNFEMDSRLVVSVLIAGQTPLRDMLRRGV
jgi:general secretion pathway protein A